MFKRESVTLPKILLASQSPRRKALLESLGLPFEVVSSDIEELAPQASTIEQVVLFNAQKKASAVKRVGTNDIVIAADTLVALGDEVMGKPADSNAALATLTRLSGRTHRVLTGLALHSTRFGQRKIAVETQVSFRSLSDTEIREYVATSEPYDKAGAYGIQGFACLFVDKIEGSYSNVMGLPLEALLRNLSELTSLPPFAWIAK